MVRVSKTDKVSASTPATPAPAPLENKVVAKTASKPRAKSAAPVETPIVVSEATAAASADAAEVSTSTKLVEFGGKLQQLSGLLTALKMDFKTLEKSISREIKNAQKSKSKSKKSSGNRQPSGFVKPTKISDELAKFLGKAAGVEMARTAVSKEINAYIREKGLQDASNGRKINPDANLTKLLNLNKEDELTYFNLQRYMKHHFIKEVPATVVV